MRHALLYEHSAWCEVSGCDRAVNRGAPTFMGCEGGVRESAYDWPTPDKENRLLTHLDTSTRTSQPWTN